MFFTMYNLYSTKVYLLVEICNIQLNRKIYFEVCKNVLKQP